jgi:hypothetical protein
MTSSAPEIQAMSVVSGNFGFFFCACPSKGSAGCIQLCFGVRLLAMVALSGPHLVAMFAHFGICFDALWLDAYRGILCTSTGTKSK